MEQIDQVPERIRPAVAAWLEELIATLALAPRSYSLIGPRRLKAVIEGHLVACSIDQRRPAVRIESVYALP